MRNRGAARPESGLHRPARPDHFSQPVPANPATLQLGEPAYLVDALRAPVVSNFRAADMVAGGQGAPLATLFHQRVFARRGRRIVVNNLGGVSNVTALDGRKGAGGKGPGLRHRSGECSY